MAIGTSGAIIARIVSQYSNAGTKAAERDLKKFGAGIDKWAKRAAKAFAVVAAAAVFMAVKIGKQAVDSASHLNESISKTGVVFEESAKQILAWSKTTADSMGQSQTQSLDAASTFGMFAQAAGLAGDSTAGFSMQMTALASDFASMFDSSPEEAINAISSAFRGQMKPISKYNLFLNDAALRNQALAMGIYDGNGSLTAQQKILAVYELLLKGSTKAQGDFLRTSDQLANSTRQVTANFENAKAELGMKLLPVVLTFARLLLDKVIPAIEAWVGRNGDKLANAFASAAGALMTFAYFVQKVFTTISDNIGVFQGLAVLLTSIWVASKVALYVESLYLIVKAFRAIRTAAVAATAATATASGGISLIAAGTGILAFGGTMVAMTLAVKEAEKQFNKTSTSVKKSTSLMDDFKAETQDYSSVLKGLNINIDKQTAKTAKLTKTQDALIKAEGILAKLKKMGIKPTNELDPIQLEAARLNLLKQGNMAEMDRLAAVLNNLEAQLKSNDAIQRYVDLLGVVSDSTISNEEILLLSAKWGISKDKVLAYIGTVFMVSDGKISRSEIEALAEQWGITKKQAGIYLDFFGALNSGTLSPEKIVVLADKWGLTNDEVVAYAKKISEGFTPADIWGKSGDKERDSWKDALKALNKYLEQAALPVVMGPTVLSPGQKTTPKKTPTSPANPSTSKKTPATPSSESPYAWMSGAPAYDPMNSNVFSGIKMGYDYESLFETLDILTNGQKIPKLASGGIVKSPTIAMIGEAGPELVVPLSGGGGLGMNITVNVGGSVISENDLVSSIRNALLQGQNNGQSIINTAVNI